MKAKDLDKESHIQVVYQILKDNLRKAKKQLLEIKNNRVEERNNTTKFQRDLEAAKVRGRSDPDSLHDKVREVVNEEGTGVFRFIGSQRSLPPALKSIIKGLLSTENRRFYRYCPCCKAYDVAGEPSDTQMGEFLEFIRQQHYKTFGSPSKKPKKTEAMRLSGDSASDITDLSREGILTSALEELPKAEQAMIKKYNEKFRKLLNRSKHHDCYKIDRRNKNLKNELRDVI